MASDGWVQNKLICSRARLPIAGLGIGDLGSCTPRGLATHGWGNSLGAGISVGVYSIVFNIPEVPVLFDANRNIICSLRAGASSLGGIAFPNCAVWAYSASDFY